MKMNFKQFENIVIIILIFTLLDFLGHIYLEKNYSLEKIPDNYFLNKVLYGVPILVIAVWLWGNNYIRFQGEYAKIFILTLIVVLALQFRYYNLYSKRFNYIVLILHYLILAPILYYFIEHQKI